MNDSTACVDAMPGVPGRSNFYLFRLQTIACSTGTQGQPAFVPARVLLDAVVDQSKVNDVRQWVDTVYHKELADFGQLVHQKTQQLIERIELKLEEDGADAVHTEEVAPSGPAVRTCLTLAKRLAPHTALAPRLKWGAFTEDDGGISLVLQSLVTDRRLNCRIGPDGTVVSAIRIDETMQAHSIPVSLDDPDAPRELAKWVTKRG